MLTDPLCSRVHAVVVFEDKTWKIRDADSRNGTFVNDQKIDDATLGEGNQIRLGSTEFCFHQAELPPALTQSRAPEPRSRKRCSRTRLIGQPDVVALSGVGGDLPIRGKPRSCCCSIN